MNKENRNGIDRREFLKTAGAVAAGAVTVGIAGCDPNKSQKASQFSYQTGEVPTDKMTYRTQPCTGDRVSLLGYGCMRWPTRHRADGNGQEIDQETMNQLVDYAIEHGVNYFDTAPVYVMGQSETATGIALSRHPRDKWFIVTKMSPHRAVPPDSNMLEYSTEMYHSSMKRLQVDYLDYYLLHEVGLGGMQSLNERFIDSGVLEYLLKEREAGRIHNLGFSFHGEVEVFDYLLAQNIAWDFVQIQLNYADWRNVDGSFNTYRTTSAPTLRSKQLRPKKTPPLQQVAEIILKSEYVPCITCQYCMPCPYGLDILEIFPLQPLHQRRKYAQRRRRRSFLTGYDRSVPKLRQASHCTACGQCAPKCTQQIRIADQMIRIDRFVEQLKTGVL
jgi:predicted aldo/keto reductase-like oxidoreductase